MKIRWYIFIIPIVAMALVGCETVRGTVSGAATGASNGVQQDYQSTKEFVKEAGPKISELDQWMRKNMW